MKDYLFKRMVLLNELYNGAQDQWIKNFNANTLETEFIETKRKVLGIEYEKSAIIVPSELEEANEYFMQSPFERMEEYLEVLKKYNDSRFFNISKRQIPSRIVLNKEIPQGNIGFTGLRFLGDATKIRRIILFIGGQQIDRQFPSMSGQFDSMNIFDQVIPNTSYHTIVLEVDFLEDTELIVEWDIVRIKDRLQDHEILCSLILHDEKSSIQAGESRVDLNLLYNPVEEITIYAEEQLDSIVLSVDRKFNFHVPYKGIQNNKYVYKYVFQTPVNFSRINNADLKVKSSTKNTLHVFAKSKNFLKFSHGMAGLAFSK